MLKYKTMDIEFTSSSIILTLIIIVNIILFIWIFLRVQFILNKEHIPMYVFNFSSDLIFTYIQQIIFILFLYQNLSF